MTKAERTRQYIIEKTAILFNTKGYADTSLNDIVELTGLTRGAIYGNFTNKDELSIEVFNYQYNQLRSAIQQEMGRADGAVNKLKAMIDYYRRHYRELSARGGCAILNAATEADDSFPLLRARVRSAIRSWQKAIIQVLEDGIKAGEICLGLDTTRFASLIIAMVEGGIMLAKILKDESRLMLVLDQVDQLIETERL